MKREHAYQIYKETLKRIRENRPETETEKDYLHDSMIDFAAEILKPDELIRMDYFSRVSELVETLMH